MKVLLPPQHDLSNPLEQQILEVLRDANLAGYALLGCSFRESSSAILHEIDALLVLEPGIFVCLEAKNYSGTWTGSANEVWKCNGQEIKAVGTNPFAQVKKYSFVIKNRLQRILDSNDIFVNHFIVAPDQAVFEITGCYSNMFQPGGNVIQICHVSKLESVIGRIWANENIIESFENIGCEAIVRELLNLSPGFNLESLKASEATLANIPEPTQVNIPEPTLANIPEPTQVNIPEPTQVNIPEPTQVNIPEPTQVNIPEPTLANILKTKTAYIPRKPVKRSFWFWGSLSLFLLLAAVILPKLSKMISYFRLIRMDAEQLTIGAVNPEKNYQLLKAYLAEKTVPRNFFDYLSGQDVEIVVQAPTSDPPAPYPEGIAKIRSREWDIAFSYSPVIGLVAEDNDYRFVATMFPGSPGYQSSFFVRADSSIEFDKLSSNYTIALGDFFSASKFYMPVYDLYGSSLNVVANVNSKDIFKLVEAGQADLGVGVLGEEVPPEFKVIKKTRDLPGSGVYLSPDLSQNDLRSLEKLLLEAPEDIKKESNYDKGDPPDFQYFRGIVDRVRAVSACSNFEKSPVAFTCGDKVVTTIQGKVNGIEVANVLNKLSIAQDSGSFCNILVKDSTLNKAINYTSIFNLQGRQLRFYVGLPKGQSCSPENPIVIYQPNQIEILD